MKARGAGLAQVSEISEARAKQLRARIRERWSKDPLAMWTRYLEAIAATPFLCGENERGWRADFDWAIRPSNVLKVAEGKYAEQEDAA